MSASKMLSDDGWLIVVEAEELGIFDDDAFSDDGAVVVEAQEMRRNNKSPSDIAPSIWAMTFRLASETNQFLFNVYNNFPSDNVK